MCYSPLPPYELLANRDLDFPTMQRLRRFARYWDLVANSGNFRATTPLLWRAESRAGTLDTQPSTLTSPFAAFLAFSDWLFARVGKRHGMTKRGNRFLRQQTGTTLVSEADTRIIKRNFFPYER